MLLNSTSLISWIMKIQFIWILFFHNYYPILPLFEMIVIILILKVVKFIKIQNNVNSVWKIIIWKKESVLSIPLIVFLIVKFTKVLVNVVNVHRDIFWKILDFVKKWRKLKIVCFIPHQQVQHYVKNAIDFFIWIKINVYRDQI